MVKLNLWTIWSFHLFWIMTNDHQLMPNSLPPQWFNLAHFYVSLYFHKLNYFCNLITFLRFFSCQRDNYSEERIVWPHYIGLLGAAVRPFVLKIFQLSLIIVYKYGRKYIFSPFSFSEIKPITVILPYFI